MPSTKLESISYTYFPNLELYAPDLEGQILKAGIEFLVELRWARARILFVVSMKLYYQNIWKVGKNSD